MKLTILHINRKRGFFGGVERYVYDTAALLRENGHRCLGLFEEDAADAEKYSDAFDDVFYTKDGLSQIPRPDIVFIHKPRSVRDALKRAGGAPAALHVHDHDIYCQRGHKYFPVGRVNCPLPRNVLYCSVCGGLRRTRGEFPGVSLVNPIERELEIRAARSCARFVVLSEYMRGNLLVNKFAPERVSKIHPFVRPPQEQRRRENNPVRLLFAGQLIRGKGADLMLKALSLVKNSFQLEIAGKGRDETMLREMTAGLGLGRKVTFKGFVSEPGEIFGAADILLFPARWSEPFGMVGIEAFARGKPVIAFDTGGVREWLRDGENGILAPPGNLRAFAGAVDRLITDKPAREKMGAEGLRAAREIFTPEKYLEAVEKMARELTK